MRIRHIYLKSSATTSEGEKNMSKYHMHKKDREIKDKEVFIEILKEGKYTTIAMCRNNEPYVVTINYGLDESKQTLYFHCAKKGLKTDFIKANPQVCATVIEDKGYKMNECEHGYRTVVFWGKMSVIEDLEEKKHGMDVLLHHLEDNPDPLKKRLLKDDDAYRKVGMLKLEIQEMAGKEAH